MTDHSYAARAVLIAEAKSRCLREERGCHPGDPDWNGCYICVHRGGLAAALRAVVQELKYFGITEKSILAIADELESTSSYCQPDDQ